MRMSEAKAALRLRRTANSSTNGLPCGFSFTWIPWSTLMSGRLLVSRRSTRASAHTVEVPGSLDWRVAQTQQGIESVGMATLRDEPSWRLWTKPDLNHEK